MEKKAEIIGKILMNFRTEDVPIAYSCVHWGSKDLEKFILRETKGENFKRVTPNEISVDNPQNVPEVLPFSPISELTLGIGKLIGKDASDGYIRVNFEKKPSYFDHMESWDYVSAVKNVMKGCGIIRRRKEFPKYLEGT